MGTPASDVVTLLLERTEEAIRSGKEGGAEASRPLATLQRIRNHKAVTSTMVELFGQRCPVSYLSELRDYKPGAAMAQLKIPVLVLLAGHDSQVPERAIERWKHALAGKKDAAVKVYPGLFHLFLPSTAAGKGDTPDD
jgi:alpha-beta hydrolase superfamily lysophospholipase